MSKSHRLPSISYNNNNNNNNNIVIIIIIIIVTNDINSYNMQILSHVQLLEVEIRYCPIVEKTVAIHPPSLYSIIKLGEACWEAILLGLCQST